MSFLRDLKVRRGSFELNIPSLKLEDGQVSVLYGDSGSGKSTLVALLTDQIKSENFYWEHQKVVLSELSVSERCLGVVFQDLGLFPHMTARQNIEFAAQARGLDLGKVPTFLAELEPVFQVKGILDQRVGQLSGGESQRVALIRSLAGRPRFLLWDEPFSALQVDMKENLRGFLKNFVRDQGLTALLISHDPRDREFFSPHVHQIHNGYLVGLDQQDPTEPS